VSKRSGGSVGSGGDTPRPTAAGGEAQTSDGGACASHHSEECAICLDALQQPLTMPCGHRFCRGCVASMQQHGVGEAQVCPLCRGQMPDPKRLFFEAMHATAQVQRWKGSGGCDVVRGIAVAHPGTTMPRWVRKLPPKAVALCQEALSIDPDNPEALVDFGRVLCENGELKGALSPFSARVSLSLSRTSSSPCRRWRWQ
jgi:hypothetical protein